MSSIVDDQQILDALHPFGFVTDPSGTILALGRSVRKLCPSLQTDRSFLEEFAVTQPTCIPERLSPDQLCGDLVVLSKRGDTKLDLRGQVVSYKSPSRGFLFALQPVLLRIEDVVDLGIDFGDFAIGDPVFDVLIFTQAQRAARKSLEAAKSNLEWENTSARLVHRLTVETYDLPDPQQAYSTALGVICESLNWEVGHVFIRESIESARLVSTSIWHLSNPETFHDLITESDGLSLAEGEGLPGQALQSRRAIWISNVKDYRWFARMRAIRTFPRLTGVAVPIILEGCVVAVMEFFTTRELPNQGGILRLFEMVGYQLSSVIARQKAREKEAAQSAMLARASKMATLGELAAGIAHEIRNPVSTISMITEILKRSSISGVISQEALTPQLGRLSLCVDRISKIVSELQTFSRDSSLDDFRVVPLGHLIEQTLALCEARFKKDAVKLITEPVPSGWSLECRDSQISQVLLNLLGNAHDAAMEAPERWVKLAAEEIGDFFELSITDSGRGITDEIADKILDPFFTTKPAGKGTGLGLSISHKIVVEHMGQLALDRASPHTRFTVRLPKRRSDVGAHDVRRAS
jgi:signal transduction histidine kinase